MQIEYQNILYKLAKKAFNKGEVPVAALIVHNGKIISTSYNKRRKNNILGHAEIECIIKATKKLNDWRLSNCEMYVTLMPCHMCLEIIKESRIKKVYYLLENEKVINFKTDFIKIDSSITHECRELLTSFFKNIR